MLDCSFIVDSTNVNGYGVKTFKNSGRIYRVFMNTSAAFTGTSHTSTLIDGISSTANLKVGMPVQGSGIPAGATIASIVDAVSITLTAATSTSTTGSITYQAIGSPNPAAGLILVQLQDNYNKYLGGYASFTAPLTGSAISSGLVKGKAYVIVDVNASTNAQWQAAGLPSFIKPAVGACFIAAATSVAGGGTVELAAAAGAGVSHVELIGDPNVMNSTGATVIGTSPGMSLVYGCYGSSTSAVTSVLTMASYTPAGTNDSSTPPLFTGTPAVLTGTIANSGGATALVLAAPANGTQVNMNFYLNDSAQGV